MSKIALCEPAHSIVRRLGGDSSVARELGLSRITVWLWQVPAPRGRDGYIPRRNHDALLALAKRRGVSLGRAEFLGLGAVVEAAE